MGSGAACQGCGRLSGVLQANLTPSAKVTALVGYLRTTVALIDLVIASANPQTLRRRAIELAAPTFQLVTDAAPEALLVEAWRSMGQTRVLALRGSAKSR